MLVDFIIIGAMKSGTTSLSFQLASNPEVCFSEEKEPLFFNRVSDWRFHLDDYHSLFRPKADQLCCEASTGYTMFPEYKDTHNRLFEYNPKMKLIYIMRQPIERIISHYSHNYIYHHLRKPIDMEVLSDPRYVDRSRYGVQISPYLELFGQQNVLLLLFEDYIRDTRRILEEIATFLGIENVFPMSINSVSNNPSIGVRRLRKIPSKINQIALINRAKFHIPLPRSILHILWNQATYQLSERPTLSSSTRKTLWGILEQEVLQIEDLMGRRLDEWQAHYQD